MDNLFPPSSVHTPRACRLPKCPPDTLGEGLQASHPPIDHSRLVTQTQPCERDVPPQSGKPPHALRQVARMVTAAVYKRPFLRHDPARSKCGNQTPRRPERVRQVFEDVEADNQIVHSLRLWKRRAHREKSPTKPTTREPVLRES